MPLLHMGNDGEIYEVDSSENNSTKVGSKATYVEDDNLLKLSMKESKEVLNDRKKLDELKAQTMKHALLGQLQKAAKTKALYDAKNLAYFRKNLQLQQHIQKLKERDSEVMARAIMTGKMDLESLPGVSGHGRSTGGARPNIDFPPLDWQEEIPVAEAFGAYQEYTTVDELNLNAMTDDDRYVVRQFQDDVYPVRLAYYINGERYPDGDYKFVMDSQYKQQIEQDKLNFVGSGERAKSMARGWMWSGFHDEYGNWQNVRVPLIYGLPQDDPQGVAEGNQSALMMRKILWTGNPSYQPGKMDSLKPVILAYAKILRDKEASEQEPVKQEVATTVTSDKVQTTVAQEKLKSTISMDYAHPMLQTNLIPRKG